MILEATICLATSIVYGGFLQFRKEKNQEVLKQIANEIHLEKQALLPPPATPKVEENTQKSLYDVTKEMQKIRRDIEQEFERKLAQMSKPTNTITVTYSDLQFVYRFLKGNNGRQVEYNGARYRINCKENRAYLLPVNSGGNITASTSSLEIRSDEDIRSVRSSAQYTYELNGFLKGKDHLLKNFTDRFTFLRETTDTKEVEYFEFIRKVKQHYTDKGHKNFFLTIDSAVSFLEYCHYCSISISHLDRDRLMRMLKQLEKSDITLNRNQRNRSMREDLEDRYPFQ